jgi:hypothetical protein
MERRSSLVRSTAPELNDGEGVGLSGWGATLGSSEALGPAYEDRGWVRWLGTDEVAETEVSVAVMAYQRRTQRWCV